MNCSFELNETNILLMWQTQYLCWPSEMLQFVCCSEESSYPGGLWNIYSEFRCYWAMARNFRK